MDEKQVNVKPVAKPSEDECLGHELDEVNISSVDMVIERKDMHVGKSNEDVGSCVESETGEELLMGSPLIMNVMATKDSDVGSLVDDPSSVESDSMHGSEDLDNVLEFADDEREDELDTKCLEDDSSREEDGVEIASVKLKMFVM